VQITTEVEEINVNPVLNFYFALKAPESKRQYPKRLEKFLDYLKLEGTFENKVLSFYKKAIENPQCRFKIIEMHSVSVLNLKTS
jgi:hypothetical protein